VPVRLIRGPEPLPPAESADPRGLVAIGGDLDPMRLLDAYRRGIFPWYDEGLPILWHSPDPRMVLPIDEVRVNRSLAKAIRRAPYRVSLDEACEDVIARCAATPRPGQEGTWITREMHEAYVRLHELGFCHSVEAWDGDRLVGGVYGVCVFAHAPDASKIAFVHLVQQLARWKVELVDCQVHTEHLARFGARPWSRSRYLDTVARLVRRTTPRGRWRFDPDFEVKV
jgi:leucyl/phenylalanyl-tRNA--protein transferase